MSFHRVLANEHTVVVVNYAQADGAARLAGLPPNARLQRLYPRAPHEAFAVGSDGTLSVPAAPLSVQVLIVSD
jgi:hypothetical protein